MELRRASPAVTGGALCLHLPSARRPPVSCGGGEKVAIGAESLSELRAARATLIAVAKLAHSCECLSDRDVIDIRNALRVARSPQRTPASVVASATSACEELSQVLSRRLPDDLDLRSALPAAGGGQPVASQSTSLINVASSSRRIRKNVRRCRLNAIPRANGAAGDFASNQVRSFSRPVARRRYR
jgi:hypothetical protein